MPLIVNGEALADQVRRDGLPRTVTALDELGKESRHVLYLGRTARGDEIVRSTEAQAWPESLPPDPTPEQVEAAIKARRESAASFDAALNGLRARVYVEAQDVEGLQPNQLTSTHVRHLLQVLLHNQGALNADGTIKPLSEWTQR